MKRLADDFQGVLPQELVFRVGHLFCGMGGGALGFKHARGEYAGVSYRYENVAGVDVMPARAKAFEQLTGAPGVVMDLFTRRDYIAFHSKFQEITDESILPELDRMLKRTHDADGLVDHDGRRFWRNDGTWAEVVRWVTPPADWAEVTPEDMRRVFGSVAPDVFFLSPPCQGFSMLNPAARAGTWKYAALNNLVLRGIYLCILAWPDHPVPVFMFENVPGIKQRGAKLLEEAQRFVKANGYAMYMSNHDAGEIGGLAQRRPRFLAIMRHEQTVPQFIYKPTRRGHRPIRDVIGPLPMPGDPAGGPLHRRPKLDFITELRLSLIRPAGDWKDIPGPGEWRLVTMDGREVPADVVAQAIKSRKFPDPAVWGRIFRTELLPGAKHYPTVQLGHEPMGHGRGADWVQNMDDVSGTVTSDPSHRKSGGASVVADDRLNLRQAHMNETSTQGNKYWVKPMNGPASTATGARFGSGAQAIADDRIRLDLRCPDKDNRHASHLRPTAPEDPAGAATAADHLANGAQAMVDTRLGFSPRDNAYANLNMDETAPAVPGNANATSSNGPGAVADTRLHRIPKGGTMSVWPMGVPGKTVTTHTDVNGDAPSLADARMRCKPHNGILGVLAWDGPSSAIIASLDVYAGAAAVADQRVTIHWWPEWFPEAFIISPWNAHHRALTKLELAVIQGIEPFDEEGRPFTLEGTGKDVLQAIGNMVPPPAAEAIGNAIAPTLVVAKVFGPDAWMLSPTGEGVWVEQDGAQQPEVLAGD